MTEKKVFINIALPAALHAAIKAKAASQGVLLRDFVISELRKAILKK